MSKKCNLKIELPNSKAFAYETHPDLPKMHQQVLCVGKRGSGKTVSVVNLVKKLDFDRIFVISPTFRSNQANMELLAIDENDVFEDLDDLTVIDRIKEEVESEAKEYDDYHKRKDLYKKFLKHKNSGSNIPDELLLEFFDPTLQQFVAPFHWLDGKRPRLCLIYDDILGSPLMSKGARKVSNLAILHRHCGPVVAEKGGALGISIFYLSQSFTIQSGGIPRCVRNNCTSLILFKSKNEKEYDQIADEVAGEIGKEEFKKVYDYATDEPHSFLFVDLHPKSNHPSRFRKNFNEFLVTGNFSESET